MNPVTEAAMSMLPSYKEIVELLKKGLRLEAEKKIMQLEEFCLELRKDNLDLRNKIEQLEADLNLAQKLVFDADAYWLNKTDGTRDGPYCVVCQDEQKKLVRLHDGRNGYNGARWICRVCDNSWT